MGLERGAEGSNTTRLGLICSSFSCGYICRAPRDRGAWMGGRAQITHKVETLYHCLA